MDFKLALILGVVNGLLSAFYAQRRGKNPYLWFLLGFAFGLMGLLALFLFLRKKNPRAESAAQPVTIADTFWYYLDSNNQQQGPITPAAFQQALSDGAIREHTFVWNEQMEGWKPWREVAPS